MDMSKLDHRHRNYPWDYVREGLPGQLLDLYKWRHLIKNFFCKLKEFKRVAMRSDKTDTSFAAMIHLGAAIINSR